MVRCSLAARVVLVALAGLVGLVGLAPSARAAPRRVGVVVVGDPAAAARLAAAVERRLAGRPGLELVAVARVAAATGPAAAPPLLAELPARLQRAIDLFYGERADDALAELTALERELGALAEVGARAPVVHAPRVQVALWRAAVLERRWADGGRAEPAPAEVRAAARAVLRLDPDVQIDMETFWPRFAALIEAERRALPRIELHVRDLPAAAQLWLDGRPVSRRAAAVAGRYRLQGSAEGYVSREEIVDATRDLELSWPLAPSVAPAAAAELDAALRASRLDVAAARARRIRALASAEALLVLTASPARGRGALIGGGGAQRSAELAPAALLDWIDRALARPHEPVGWRWSLIARMALASTGKSFSWAQSRIDGGRTGGGALVGLRAERERWRLALDARLAKDAVVDTPSSRAVTPAPTTGRAGWLGVVEASAGVRVGGERLALTPRVRVALHSHRGGELIFPEGGDPLTGSFTSVGLGVGAALRVRLPAGAALEAGVAFDPLSGYLEEPVRAGSANPPEHADGEALLTVELGGDWVGELGAAYERIELQYVGAPPAQLTPAPIDAHRTDEVVYFWLGGRRRW
ncbi:MAG: hypothetical protein R3B48_05065 [Kofleriaceae bacterium]